MTKLEIIEETVAYYAADPNGRRGLSSTGACEYLTPDGKRCAVGRYFKEGVEIPNSNKFACRLDLPNLLQDKYLGHNSIFWTDLQGFHDRSDNWDDKGLTDQGKLYLEELKEQYSKE